MSHKLWRKCLFNFVIQVLHCIPLFRDCINKLRPPIKRVALKTRKLFREIETSNDLVRTLNYVRYLSLQGYEPGIMVYILTGFCL